MKWQDTIEDLSIEQVLRLLRVEFRGNRLAPCPKCHEVNRSSSSRRPGPVGFGRDSWKCHRCGERGGSLALASWLLLGQRLSAGDGAFWERFETAWKAATGLGADRPVIRLPASTYKAPSARPPLSEVRELWNASKPVTEDTEVAEWLEGRGLRPFAIARRDLARALPERFWCPRWATFCGEQWSRSGHRLLLRAVGPSGRSGWSWSLRARNIKAGVAGKDKTASAALGPGSASGLLYADDHARKMLAGRAKSTQLIVTEGEPDWLTWTDREVAHNSKRPWGVVGVWSGAWTEDIAARIPEYSTVVLRTHRDKAGREYARRITATLTPRNITVYRLTGEGPDENDQLRFGRLEYEPMHGCREAS